MVSVYDPSNFGSQPYGKQRVGAIGFFFYTFSFSILSQFFLFDQLKKENPGGDTYTPSSGIWQTVWLENVPSNYIEGLKITPNLNGVRLNVTSSPLSSLSYLAQIKDGGKVVASVRGVTGKEMQITIDNAKLWSPQSPFLYDLSLSLFSPHNSSLVEDSVDSYFGLRTIEIGKDSNNITRPLLNKQFIFLAGWLDQRLFLYLIFYFFILFLYFISLFYFFILFLCFYFFVFILFLYLFISLFYFFILILCFYFISLFLYFISLFYFFILFLYFISLF